MEPVVVRPAHPGDVAALVALAEAAYGPYVARLDGRRPAPMDADYAAAVTEREVLIAEAGGLPVGLLVCVDEPQWVLLENVAVDPRWQGHGIGRDLVRLAEGRALARGVGVRLYTHVRMVENQRLYESLGFVEVERRCDDGFDRVFYEKPPAAGFDTV